MDSLSFCTVQREGDDLRLETGALALFLRWNGGEVTGRRVSFYRIAGEGRTFEARADEEGRV